MSSLCKSSLWIKITMQLLLVLSLLFGYAYCQVDVHGHDLNVLVAKGFARLDTNKDGILETNEYEAVLKVDDTDGDGTITCDEYVAHSSASKTIALQIFTAFDPDHDCSLTHAEALSLLTKMDQTGDGQVSEHEFEHFYLQLLKQLGHVDHGHQVVG
ncbi:Hypothetical predicted protein [Mytilus galloprovincialis]|uniref:EF-hand domain-containing protein n=2 Tax=Mytilus galloprovincialis TaxID=29158 RepID=A0A8B6H3C2_MYTGA|nr:Hypothetical predicted protein [Mytilus galloprovincialis]